MYKLIATTIEMKLTILLQVDPDIQPIVLYNQSNKLVWSWSGNWAQHTRISSVSTTAAALTLEITTSRW